MPVDTTAELVQQLNDAGVLTSITEDGLLLRSASGRSFVIDEADVWETTETEAPNA